MVSVYCEILGASRTDSESSTRKIEAIWPSGTARVCKEQKDGEMKRLIILILAVFLIAGCSPKPEQLQPFVEQTVSAIPTQTAYPTYTPNPTHTPYPTYTKVPTQTPKVIVVTPTNTPTSTLTLTPLQSPTPTEPPTYTPQPWQLTQEAKKATQQALAEYEQVNIRDYTTYPDKYAEKKIKVSGQIFNIIDKNTFQIWISGTREAVVVLSIQEFDNLYENDYVTIYGLGGKEKHCGTNAMGGEVCQPMVLAVQIEK
jgi:hypothetical protein